MISIERPPSQLPFMVEGYIPKDAAPPVPTLPYASVYDTPHNWNGMVGGELEAAVFLLVLLLLLATTAVLLYRAGRRPVHE